MMVLPIRVTSEGSQPTLTNCPQHIIKKTAQGSPGVKKCRSWPRSVFSLRSALTPLPSSLVPPRLS